MAAGVKKKKKSENHNVATTQKALTDEKCKHE